MGPQDNSIEFDFETMFDQGEAQYVEVVDGELVLEQMLRDVYYPSGNWVSPIFDTQKDYVLWEWVYGEADFKGLQKYLLHDGDFEDPQCTSSFGGEQWPMFMILTP